MFRTAGPGYTGRIITSPDADIVEDQVVAGPGSYSATASVDNAWVMQMAAFRAASSSPTTAPTSTTASTTTSTTQAPTPATPTLVQVDAATPQTPESSVSVGYDNPEAAGDTNVAVIGWNDTTSNITSVTDSNGNTYTVAAPVTRGSKQSQAIYYAKDIEGGADTLTVTFDRAAASVDSRIMEYAGLDQANPFDAQASASGDSGGTASSGPASTSSSNDLLVGGGTTQGVFRTAGPGYTGRIITSPDADIVEDQVVADPGSYSATASVDNAWVMQMAAFRAASSSPTTAPTSTTASTSTSISATTPQ